MKTYRIYVKGHAQGVDLKADEHTFQPSGSPADARNEKAVVFKTGQNIIGYFLLAEIQGFRVIAE